MGPEINHVDSILRRWSGAEGSACGRTSIVFKCPNLTYVESADDSLPLPPHPHLSHSQRDGTEFLSTLKLPREYSFPPACKDDLDIATWIFHRHKKRQKKKGNIITPQALLHPSLTAHLHSLCEAGLCSSFFWGPPSMSTPAPLS